MASPRVPAICAKPSAPRCSSRGPGGPQMISVGLKGRLPLTTPRMGAKLWQLKTRGPFGCVPPRSTVTELVFLRDRLRQVGVSRPAPGWAGPGAGHERRVAHQRAGRRRWRPRLLVDDLLFLLAENGVMRLPSKPRPATSFGRKGLAGNTTRRPLFADGHIYCFQSGRANDRAPRPDESLKSWATKPARGWFHGLAPRLTGRALILRTEEKTFYRIETGRGRRGAGSGK